MPGRTVCLSIEYAYPRDANVKTSDDITSSCFAKLQAFLRHERGAGTREETLRASAWEAIRNSTLVGWAFMKWVGIIAKH